MNGRSDESDICRLPRRESDDVLLFEPSRLARHHRLVLDTDSLLSPHGESVLCGQLLPVLVECKAEALISSRSIDALNAGIKSPKSAISDAAKRGASIVRRFQDGGVLIDARDPHVIAGDTFDTESLLTELFVGYQQREALCLVTQNEALALAVLRNARSEAFSHAKSVVAAYVGHDGLRNWAPELAAHTILPSTGMDVSGEEMAVALRDCKIFVDTCSWMLDDKTKDGAVTRGASFLLQHVLPKLHQHSNPLMQPERVQLELEHHVATRQDAHAQAGLDALQKFQVEGMAVLASDPDEVAGVQRFADPVFVRLAVRFQSEFDLCFVTQDTKLAELLLGCRKPGTGRLFLVTYIPMRGNKLQPWSTKLNKHTSSAADVNKRSENSPHKQQSNPPRPKPQSREPRAPVFNGFRILTELTKPDPTPIAVTAFPVAGDTVVGAQSGPLILIERIAAGGEGIVYRTNLDGLVCKVYHRECLTRGRREKLNLMVSQKIHIKGVCWPVELVSNLQQEFVGFLMPMASGKMLRTSVFAKALLAKHFPEWTRIELTELAITMLKVIRELHFIGVLVGDVNPQNILVQGPRRIAIVDTDSFQVEGYACPVGTETFTPPNRQGQAYSEFLRSHDDELYAVATLLFETLFPGKAPYSAQGGGDVSENMRTMRFAYGREAEGRPPIGPWGFIWSHLNPRLKDDFTAVFARGERVCIDDFIKNLEWSLKEMREGSRDKSLFPKQPWQREGQTVTMRCGACPPERANHEVNQYLADKLKAEGKEFVCSPCAAMKKMSRLQNTREVDCQSKISPHCEGSSLANIERLVELKRKGKPYWCRHCSKQQAELWAAENATKKHARRARTRHQPNSSPCFVATAVYQDPMAAPVVALRRYRDNVLADHVAGRAFIRIYYHVGPWLAKVVHAYPILRPPLKRFLDHLSLKLTR